MRRLITLFLALLAPAGSFIAAQDPKVDPPESDPTTEKKNWNPWSKLRKPPEAGPTGVSGAPSDSGAASKDSASDDDEPYTGGEWFAVPIPIIDPTIQTGLAGAGGYIYRLNPNDAESPPSITGGAGFGTSNGSWGAFGAHDMAWGRDRWRMRAIGGYASVNFAFGGVREDSGEEDFDVPVKVEGALLSTEFLGRFVERWFVGPRYNLFLANTSLRVEQDPDLPPDFPPLALDVATSSLGFKLLRDTRDEKFYPRRGSMAEFTLDFNRPAFGSGGEAF